MGQGDLPFLGIFNPANLVDIGVELYFVHNLVFLADVGQILGYLGTRRVEGGPVLLGGKGE
mgnify:CR=1 FL=1